MLGCLERKEEDDIHREDSKKAVWEDRTLVKGPQMWLTPENLIATAAGEMFGATLRPKRSGSPVLRRENGESGMMKIAGLGKEIIPSLSSSLSSSLASSSSVSLSSPSSSSSESPSPSPTHFHSQRKEPFCQFLRSEVAVKAVFNVGESEPELPLHFFILCDSFRMATVGVRALIPNAPLNEEGEGCAPLSSFFSYLHQTLGHSYLHSVIGTFAHLCQESFLQEYSSPPKKKRDLMGSFESRHAVEQGFQYLMKMIAVSIPEIPGQIKKSLAVLCSSSKSGPKEKRSFVLRCFLTNFICSGLATPEVTLNMRLTQETKDFCSLLSHLLQVASTGPPAVGKDANFINTLTQSSYVQKKIDFIWSHLTTEEEEEPGLMQCYIDFFENLGDPPPPMPRGRRTGTLVGFTNLPPAPPSSNLPIF